MLECGCGDLCAFSYRCISEIRHLCFGCTRSLYCFISKVIFRVEVMGSVEEFFYSTCPYEDCSCTGALPFMLSWVWASWGGSVEGIYNAAMYKRHFIQLCASNFVAAFQGKTTCGVKVRCPLIFGHVVYMTCLLVGTF